METELRRLYEEKKTEIKNRLQEFKQMMSQPDEKIFSELSFCLCTPQSKAKECDKAIKALEKNNLLYNGNERQIQAFLSNVRFPENKSKFIVNARNLFTVDKQISIKDKITSFKNSKEAREWLMRNVKGIGYKEASLPYNEKILVIIDNKVKFIEIGEFVNNYHKGLYKCKKLQTYAFNPKTLKIEIAPITNVFKHKYKKDLFEVSLKMGKKVRVTGDHSLFTTKNGEVIATETRSLKKGDFVAVPSFLPTINSVEKDMNLVKEFIHANIRDAYIRSKQYCRYLRRLNIIPRRNNQYTQNFRGIIPIKLLKQIPERYYSSKVLKKYNVKIGFKRSPNEINSIIKFTDDLFWLLGLMIAEGYFGKNPIEITLGLEEYERALKCETIIKKIFGNDIGFKLYRTKKHTYTMKIYNLGFFYFIKYILKIEGTAHIKRVPEIVFSASKKQIISFLQGYWEGDGWKKSLSYMSISTVSENLANDLLILFLMVNVTCRHCLKNRTSHTIDLNNVIKPLDIDMNKKVYTSRQDVIPNIGNILHEIHKKFGIKSKINGQHTKLYEKIMQWKTHVDNPSRFKLKEVIEELEMYGRSPKLNKIKKILNSDIMFLKIKEIKKLDYKEKYVYDIEVDTKENHQNFVGGFGGIFLHNSHFLRNIGLGYDLAILDRHILRSLVEFKVIDEIPKSLTPKKYLEIEQKMKRFADHLNIPLAELDLLLFYRKTGEIFK